MRVVELTLPLADGGIAVGWSSWSSDGGLSLVVRIKELAGWPAQLLPSPRSRALYWPTPKSISSVNDWDVWKGHFRYSKAIGSPWYRATTGQPGGVPMRIQYWSQRSRTRPMTHCNEHLQVKMNGRGIYCGTHWTYYSFHEETFSMRVCVCVCVCVLFWEEVTRVKGGYEGMGNGEMSRTGVYDVKLTKNTKFYFVLQKEMRALSLGMI